MRPGCGTKGKQQVSSRAFFGGVPIGCAQHKACLAGAGIAPVLKCFGEFFRGKSLAALIKKHGLERGLRLGNFAACFRQFGEFDGPSQPLLITRDQLRLRRASNLSASDNVKEDWESLS